MIEHIYEQKCFFFIWRDEKRCFSAQRAYCTKQHFKALCFNQINLTTSFFFLSGKWLIFKWFFMQSFNSLFVWHVFYFRVVKLLFLLIWRLCGDFSELVLILKGLMMWWWQKQQPPKDHHLLFLTGMLVDFKLSNKKSSVTNTEIRNEGLGGNTFRFAYCVGWWKMCYLREKLFSVYR